MADEPVTDPSNDPQALTTAYSKFYVADPTHSVDINTKADVEAPEIRADFNRAAAGADVVSDLEMTTLSGNNTRVYRPDPLHPAKIDATPEATALLSLIERKIQTGQWSPADAAEENRLITATATALKIDETQAREMADGYENGSVADNRLRASQFGGTLQHGSPELRTAIGETLTRQAFGQTVTPEEQQQLAANLEQFRAENNFRKQGFDEYVDHFKASIPQHVADRQSQMVEMFNNAGQDSANGYGEAFTTAAPPTPGEKTSLNYVAVPKTPGPGDNAAFAAWLVNPADPPGRLPPGSPELGNFLTSLHESEHLSRQGDAVGRPMDAHGKNGLTNIAVEQANEIDADKAVIKYLDDNHEPAAKEYWLQAREVNSFTQGVISPDNPSHDTATFLRVLDKTGQQLDLDAFNREKRGLLERINEKAALTDIGRNQARTADVMGAVADVLADDKANKDPAKALSPMQRAEAESFLRDAKAMGYTANPNYPKPAAPAAEASAPAAATPAQTTDKTPAAPRAPA